MRILVAGPFPPSPDAAANAALRTVQDLPAKGHALEAISPLPSAADEGPNGWASISAEVRERAAAERERLQGGPDGDS